MKIDKITGEKCLNRRLVPSRAKAGVVLFADFLPAESDVSLAASDLVVAAQASGVEMTSATFARDSFAQVSLSCRTPMYFRRAKQSVALMNLAGAARVVVVLDSFMRAELQSTTRFRRLKERRRMLFLLAEILRARPDAVIIASGGIENCYLGAARILSALKSGRFHRPDIRPVSDFMNGCLARDIGLAMPAPDAANRQEMLEQHAGLGLVQRRMTLQTLLANAAASPHEEDLRFLIKIAANAALKSHPTIRWLRKATSRQPDVHECPGPHRLLQKAQALAPEAARFNLPITRYMMHLHDFLQLQNEFPLKTGSQAQAYLNWYRKRCFERVPARWVPCPPAGAGRAQPDDWRIGSRAARAERIVLGVLDSSLSTVDPDTEMLTFLAGNPAGIGPSRFAILLAALCQIPARLQSGEPVWKSEEIRIWHAETACRLIPACRQFIPGAKPPEIPARSLMIYGMAGGKTGLGANAVMAEKMAEQLSLPYAIRDVDGAEPERLSRPAAGRARVVKKDVVLHHVNADRIPLQIMSPDLAQRNDAYHIGFLLWELDRIPQAHRLGIEMLNEIWAPSRFVADLHANQTSTPVHLVKKGLIDLDRLREISAAGRNDAGRFTAMICFDFHSSVERKNPLAAVRAFQIAFPRHSHGDCRLIVKTTPTSRGHWGDPADQMGQIRKLAARDARIEIIEAFVSQPDLWRMMNSADCILSTHRAEGFGYIPAYALALAKPLVTTDYGGPTDFCNHRTSFPVAPPLTDVPKGHGLYSPAGARWADVPPEAVAVALRQVYDDPGMAAARARHGQELMRKDYSMAAYAARCRYRLEQIGAL